jgi:salicylate hydroxylase
MIEKAFHVAIVGGGIGGLCLAQGLKKAGINVAVCERDRTRTDRLQGYRVHISPRGSRALYDCLPPGLYKTFSATSSVSSSRFRFLTERMEELLAFEMEAGSDAIEHHHSASRITLRQILLAGLDDIVRFDKTLVDYTEAPEGCIGLRFSDGSSAVCDLLVCADGGNSRVRK